MKDFCLNRDPYRFEPEFYIIGAQGIMRGSYCGQRRSSTSIHVGCNRSDIITIWGLFTLRSSQNKDRG
jgi:hypothetical protein